MLEQCWPSPLWIILPLLFCLLSLNLKIESQTQPCISAGHLEVNFYLLPQHSSRKWCAGKKNSLLISVPLVKSCSQLAMNGFWAVSLPSHSLKRLHRWSLRLWRDMFRVQKAPRGHSFLGHMLLSFLSSEFTLPIPKRERQLQKYSFIRKTLEWERQRVQRLWDCEVYLLWHVLYQTPTFYPSQLPSQQPVSRSGSHHHRKCLISPNLRPCHRISDPSFFDTSLLPFYSCHN